MDQPVVDALSQTVLVKFRVSTRESSTFKKFCRSRAFAEQSPLSDQDFYLHHHPSELFWPLPENHSQFGRRVPMRDYK
jgi:hypothetical protein